MLQSMAGRHLLVYDEIYDFPRHELDHVIPGPLPGLVRAETISAPQPAAQNGTPQQRSMIGKVWVYMLGASGSAKTSFQVTALSLGRSHLWPSYTGASMGYRVCCSSFARAGLLSIVCCRSCGILAMTALSCWRMGCTTCKHHNSEQVLITVSLVRCVLSIADTLHHC